MSLQASAHRLIDHTPTAGVSAAGGVAVLAAGTWLTVVIVSADHPPPSLSLSSPSPQAPGIQDASGRSGSREPGNLVIPESVLTVTLADELFPKPKPAVTAVSNSKLTLQLIAITGEGENRRVFVRDSQADVYFDLGIGEPASPGITLSEINDTSAVFLVSGAPVTVELPK